jgi:hypothetical protein
VCEGKAEEEGMSREVLMPRTPVKLIPGAISGVLILIVVIMVLNGIQQSSTDPFPDNSSNEVMQNTQDNFVLGMAILLFGGTFGIIAYYYKNIDFGLKK